MGASVEGYGSRVRRGRPGRLGFGTFEAWCQWRPGGGGPSRAYAVPGFSNGGGFSPAQDVLHSVQDALQKEAPLDAQGAAPLDAQGAAPLEMEVSRSKAPPSLQAVVRYFEEALGEDPVYEEAGRFRFERWEGFPWGASWRRCLVSGGRGSVCLEWWANDDFGVSELREFFEAPFFELSESLVLHQWMGEGGWHWGVLRGARLAMGVLSRGDYVYVRIRWWQPPV